MSTKREGGDDRFLHELHGDYGNWNRIADTELPSRGTTELTIGRITTVIRVIEFCLAGFVLYWVIAKDLKGD